MSLPDIATNPDAVLGDLDAKWRTGSGPNGQPPLGPYRKTREYYNATKTKTWDAGSLEDIVSNLVKNWEIEASYKTDYNDWRTVDKEHYTFKLAGGENVPGQKMVEIGTYNALLSASEYYSPEHNSYSDSHKTFKRMMPTFAWEVLEVKTGPPTVEFKWRHWGQMKNDYVGYNKDGKKCRVKAPPAGVEKVVSIEGWLVAEVNDKLQIKSIEVKYDPMSFFEQTTKDGAEVLIEDSDAPVTGGSCPITGAAGAACPASNVGNPGDE